MRLVMVEWVDSFGCSTEWAELDGEASPEPMVCRSVGWLLHDGDTCKVIVPHVADVSDAKQQGCGDMTIPAECIRKMVDLAEPVTRPALTPETEPAK